MDEVDSPFLKKKKSMQKKSDTIFQSELQMKLQQRRKDGLTYGLTSEESDSLVDDDDGDSDEEILAQHRRNLSNQKHSNRPSSAKRRTPTFQDTSDMSLGDTIRPVQGGNRFMKQRGQQGQKESIPPLSMGGKGGRTSPGMPSLTSPKLSPKDSKSLSDALGGKRTPSPKYPNQSMSQEDIIFGRKTPTNDPRRQSPTDNKPWQPPNFRKSLPQSSWTTEPHLLDLVFKAEELLKIHFYKALTRMGKRPERIDFLVQKTAAQREVLLVPRIDFPSLTENLQRVYL